MGVGVKGKQMEGKGMKPRFVNGFFTPYSIKFHAWLSLVSYSKLCLGFNIAALIQQFSGFYISASTVDVCCNSHILALFAIHEFVLT